MIKKSNINIYEAMDDLDLFGDELGIAKMEESHRPEIDDKMTVSELREDVSDNIESTIESTEDYLSEFADDIDEFLEDLEEEAGGDTKVKKLIPGTNMFAEDFDKEEEELKEKDYKNDGNLKMFLNYVNDQYPSEIPSHDGTSILGCERAITFLKKLSDEIRRNIRLDEDGDLEDQIDGLERVNTSILADIYTLNAHMKNLDKKLRDQTKKASVPEQYMTKSASTPSNVVITVDPFIRAITGILVNSVVSAGKSFEEVYDYLCEKYDITEREELMILQVLMDMGQPIFKDRGSLKTEKDLSEKEKEMSGVDFLTTYFA